MIATLQFRLNEEAQEFKDAIEGALWRGALTELIDSIECSLEEDVSLDDAQQFAFKQVRSLIAEYMCERGIAIL